MLARTRTGLCARKLCWGPAPLRDEQSLRVMKMWVMAADFTKRGDMIQMRHRGKEGGQRANVSLPCERKQKIMSQVNSKRAAGTPVDSKGNRTQNGISGGRGK